MHDTKSELFGGVVFGVKLTCRFGMMFGLQVMPVGRVCVLRGSVDIVAFVVFRGLPVMVRGLLMMHGCLFVMLRDLGRM
jgi:hypothetical protein